MRSYVSQHRVKLSGYVGMAAVRQLCRKSRPTASGPALAELQVLNERQVSSAPQFSPNDRLWVGSG